MYAEPGPTFARPVFEFLSEYHSSERKERLSVIFFERLKIRRVNPSKPSLSYIFVVYGSCKPRGQEVLLAAQMKHTSSIAPLAILEVSFASIVFLLFSNITSLRVVSTFPHSSISTARKFLLKSSASYEFLTDAWINFGSLQTPIFSWAEPNSIKEDRSIIHCFQYLRSWCQVRRLNWASHS